MSLTLISALGVLALARWVCVDQLAYAPLRRHIRAGRIDDQARGDVLDFHLNALGSNPTLAYRYAMVALPRGHEAVVRGVAGVGPYTSATLYDPLLQSLLPHPGQGVAHVRLPPGPFEVIVRRGGGEGALDPGEHERFVWFERHHGEVPVAVSTVSLRREEASRSV